MIVSVEIINFLNLLLTNQILQIVMNFLALVIIAEFDDLFFEVYSNEDMKALVKSKKYTQSLLFIQTTTSSEADKALKSHRLSSYLQEGDRKVQEARKKEEEATLNRQ